MLAALFTAAAGFTALQGNESIAFLIPLVGDRIDLNGILLAATVFGALGVLDDVTVTQAATVEQLHRAEPAAGRGGVIGRAMRVGRSHIAATVNTLMLAYLGAGLPLLLLFALGGQSPLVVLNGEIVAVEVIRALVGSIGIVAAVPLTTLVAAAADRAGRADGRRPRPDRRYTRPPMNDEPAPHAVLFTSESVTEGHPDKLCDAVADAILDDVLAHDPTARAAVEVATTTGLVLVSAS